jgi:hypothetical protein
VAHATSRWMNWEGETRKRRPDLLFASAKEKKNRYEGSIKYDQVTVKKKSQTGVMQAAPRENSHEEGPRCPLAVVGYGVHSLLRVGDFSYGYLLLLLATT